MVEGEILWSVLRHNDPPGSALALRLMGAVHRLVLRGDAPELAAHYPSAGGVPESHGPPFGLCSSGAPRVALPGGAPGPDDEPARCVALLGGLLEVARRTGLPLRLLEVGASAGLNLRFDRYRYELGESTWGPPAGGLPAIVAREGCDARPLDPNAEEDRLTLASYVWADQPERLSRLRAACGLAAEIPARVQPAKAGDWIEDRLLDRSAGAAPVVFHSIVLQYLGPPERERFEAALLDAGERAVAPAPLACQQMEPAGELTDVRLTLWPGGERRLIARAGYHGDPVEWAEVSS